MRRRRADRPAGRSSGRIVELDITALGQQGDGLASFDGQSVFVAFALPGERVLARLEGPKGSGLAATVLDVVVAAADRVAPPCPHFGRCGGCALQHLGAESYGQWKRDLLVTALGRIGQPAELVAPLIAIAAGTRRRASFTFRRQRGKLVIGFNARASHDVVPLEQCSLLAAPLTALLPSLATALASIDAPSGDVVVTLTDSGLDVLVACDARLDLFGHQRLAAFADAADLARLSWRGAGGGVAEPLVCRRQPRLMLGGVAVEPPPGAFLQPSVEGERALVELVVAAVGDGGAVADLFAGAGSFTFPLAKGRAVHAVDGDIGAVRALQAAATGLRITAEHRDLARRPLAGAELRRFDAVVFDPPRAGAVAQAEALAADGPARVVAVSCNPATLARDAQILLEGGYRLER
jgi:23S rRNA (uracil1939-C5)-methyltransferase